ncbi:hypothetical protein VitviT2T_018337 [Vitis vinifera]|uniref:Diacylglycerol kinase n=1 Tax=Vitis vinifera TaxID=29760 RepID=A0ABY9CXE4_VITVI|nr:uncharacterized protein LOC100243324 [Vitis vinifera]WJZ99932.1 hypothetical protein VitviT2T_018337 [Vitis vinifera]|eukprot:XP_019078849.1 PREDICTED: uncharacterized protein LOC100243324 isoform X2 [Vitis vinifera]
MSADALEFLKNKFLDDLREAEDEHLPHEIPFHSSFQEIRKLLQNRKITRSQDCMKDCLNQLNFTLANCIISLENRKMQRKKDSWLDPYLLPALQFNSETRGKLLAIKKKLLSTSDESQAKSSLPAPSPWSCSSSLSIDQIPREIDKQGEEIEHFLVDASDRDKGITRKIGIVGPGGSGKTLVARKIFAIHVNDYRIWIDLPLKMREGEKDYKNILEAMLKPNSDEQHRGMNYKNYSEEKLLEEVCKVLRSRKYLIVFDGIYDINLEWYSRLEKRLGWDNESKQDRNGIIIITTRLPGVAERMVGSQNLYHMQPISNEANWKLLASVPVDGKGIHLPEQNGFLLRMKNEIEEKCDGLPLAGMTLANVMAQYIIGEEFNFEKLVLLMINPKDSPKLGEDLITSRRSIFQQFLVCDISEIASHQTFDDFYQVVSTPRLNFLQTPERILVFGGDATANRVLGALSDREGLPHPLVAMVPLGNEVNISVSLGWGKRVTETDYKPEILLRKLQTADEILIDSWKVVMRIAIPDGLKLPNTVHIKQLSEKEILFKGGDKELHARFWNYFIIGLDAQEWYDSSGFKSWSRNATLPISIKIKDQGQWKKLDFPHSIKSIVCLNMPSFPGGLDPWGLPNQKKKQKRNFTASYVDDQLLEVIGFKDAWHGEDFLPLDIHGTRLAQVDRIQFELQKGEAKHVYMSFDGTKWKQPTPEDDDTYPIGISYSCATKMLATQTSKCKLQPPASKDETK